MTTAVVDAGPLIYLGLLDVLDVLPAMFGMIRAPSAVVRELKALRNPGLAPVRAWAASPPSWLEIRDPRGAAPGVGHLQAGEEAAISLAWESGADVIILDDAEARRVAAEAGGGLLVVGTLGILDAAAARGLLDDLPGLLDRLVGETPFRCGPNCLEIVAEMKRRDLDRKDRS